MARRPAPTRRGLTALAAGLAVLSACAPGAPDPAKLDLGAGPPVAGTVKTGALRDYILTFVSYGGLFQEGQEKAAVEPFAAESGAEMLGDGPTDQAKLQAQVRWDNVSWDIVDTDGVFAAANCGTLFQPLDPAIVDTSKIPEDLRINACSIPAMSYGYVLAYNTRKYGANPPTGWRDFFDTARFPGKRSIVGTPGDAAPGPMEAALIADGVAPDALYPLDMDRALRKMSTIRGDTVFWTTGAQAQQLLESGEVDMSMIWSGRAYGAVRNGAPYAVQWNQFFPVFDAVSVPKNARSPKASMAFINYYLGARQQARLTELTSYSPIHVDAAPRLDPLAASFLTTTPEKKRLAVRIDLGWWAANLDTAIKRYNDWLSGGR
ncbi:extracellular solute-binding protein [Pseudonocardia eucalypti]|uniref:Extracellular solute-binding protein n=1 Tax=Pseudonocardia eucalypti TaxID=648755 RepID=A0ABP9RFJ6_9PSEU|nr:putative spermidine/putrescine transport system substrate-binding protein [Pseudonocardia eucalypti]